jgi:hypothetical protein
MPFAEENWSRTKKILVSSIDNTSGGSPDYAIMGKLV